MVILYLILIALPILYLYLFRRNNNEGGREVRTTVLETGIHCATCAKEIERVLKKVKGVMEVSANQERQLVTVRGTMDGRELIKRLKKKFNRHAVIQ